MATSRDQGSIAMSEHYEGCKRVQHVINLELVRAKGKKAKRELLVSVIAYLDQLLVGVNKL